MPNSDTPIEPKGPDTELPENVISIQTPRKPRIKKEKPQLNPDDLALGMAWFDHALANLKTAPYKSWTNESFAEHLIKVKNETKLTNQQLRDILLFLKRDEFWRPNALSPDSLLKISKTNGKRKIDNILDALEREKKPTFGANYGRKTVDLSADNGKFANCDDSKPWKGT